MNSILLKTYLVFTFILATGFYIPKNIQKKADKIISSFFKIETYNKIPVLVPKSVKPQIPSIFEEDNFFKIETDQKTIGYAYIGEAKSKTASFHYLVIFDPSFIILKSHILVYREEYGGEIGSKRWLKQFSGKQAGTKTISYGEDIIPISGATISAKSMTRAINDLLQSVNDLLENKILK